MNPLFLLVLLFFVAAVGSGFIVWILSALVFFRICPRKPPEKLHLVAQASFFTLSPIASLVLGYRLFRERAFFLGPAVLVIAFFIGKRRRIDASNEIRDKNA
jgi:hypothetical protein